VYLDVNGNSSIGIGHLLKDSEAEKYTKPLKDDEIYTILAQDLLDINEDLKVLIGEDVYKDIPVCVKESVIDLAFNKGLGAVRDNSELFNGLKNKDYVKVVSNLTQDYSLVKNKNGQLVKVYLSGLNKRRLWEMNNASKIFEDNIPQEVLQSAQKVYTNGIKNMGTEVARGKISQEAYPNILAEYNLTVSKMFDGKISANSEIKDVKKNIDTSKDNTKTVLVKGKSSNFTVSTLHAEWQKTAEKNKRFIKRPLPVVNANGNIVADIKTYEPTKKGILSGKTIIINSGHGGCMANVSGEKINVNFDPGTSNAKMNSKNSNIETNQFIGNGGKALEEWDVNRKFSDNLIKKITSEGGKVIYVQGSVHTAMTAIRNIVAKNKINLLISLHSNSAGSERGIFVMPNDRGGLDKKDDELANSIVNNLNADSWFKGITHKKPKSLGVLSADKNTTLPIPAVLIETGNLKNEKDVANLNSSNFKEKMMSSIFEGIEDYLIK
jgi:N-acetylmuramoyl-L-alanine amidase/GH24 family phage-related lysozyme (muramidase)